MPYINLNERKRYDATIAELTEKLNDQSVGHLTYVLFRLCADYYPGTLFSYTLGNAVMGSLECTKAEYYRRILSKHEDFKRGMNGDVL